MQTMPMSFVQTGSQVEIVHIAMGQTFNKKLMEMGLNTGMEVKVVKNDGVQLILVVGGSKLALGQGMGQKIMVRMI
mgnify:CR=1 FL=1